MRSWCKGLSVFVLPLALAAFSAVAARAQGCIVARSSSLDMSPESQGGYLQPGDWDLTVGYSIRRIAGRHANNSYYTNTTAGLGDTALVAQGWLWNPHHAKRGNISPGLGLQAPTGKDNVREVVRPADRGSGLLSSVWPSSPAGGFKRCPPSECRG
jgi:hypothetical protein